MATPPVLSQLESFLSLTNCRQTVIASNMANIDTPGYRTEDINFEQELSKAMAGPADGHLHVALHKVNGLMERPDGNNVDMDRESLLLSETQLQYQVGTQLLKQQFHRLITAINSGSGS